MKTAFIAIATLIPALAAAQGDQVCMDAFEMEASLIDWYGEQPVQAIAPEGAQMWANPDTDTWTLVSYGSEGRACVIASGDDWSGKSADQPMLYAGVVN